jgi:predicted nucleotidyltransferase
MRDETAEWITQAEYDIDTVSFIDCREISRKCKGGGKMSETESELNNIVLSFINTLKSKGIMLEKVYIYGSRARGTSRPDSDIDLILVSPKFSNMPFWKRWEIIGDALAEIMEPIEVLAFSPEEFEEKKEKQAGFLQYIIKQPETIDVVF